MSGTQSLIGGGEVAGLGLRAWGFVYGGQLKKSYNIASLTNPTTGTFNVTLSAAMADINVLIVGKVGPQGSQTGSLTYSSLTTTAVVLQSRAGGVTADVDGFWFGIYG